MKTFSKRQKVCFLTRLRSVFTWENAYSTECSSNLSSTCPHTALSKSKMNGLKRNTLSNWLYVHLGIHVRNAIARRVLEGHDLSDAET